VEVFDKGWLGFDPAVLHGAVAQKERAILCLMLYQKQVQKGQGFIKGVSLFVLFLYFYGKIHL